MLMAVNIFEKILNSNIESAFGGLNNFEIWITKSTNISARNRVVSFPHALSGLPAVAALRQGIQCTDFSRFLDAR